MVDTFVDSAAILAHVGEGSPSADDTAWAELVADAVNARIVTRLDGTVIEADTTAEAELQLAALTVAGTAYMARPAQPAESPEDALYPVLFRYAPPGIG
jgi:hypothetical protein